MIIRNKQVKPFLKWVGGKTQLLDKLEARLPEKIKSTKVIDCYIEPFVGGGALFFYLKNRYQINKAFLIDNNQDLILTYKVIKTRANKLIKKLSSLQNKYLKYEDSERAEFFYKIRSKYNQQKKGVNYNKPSDSWAKRASFVIFLNKTCFNGLFRLNSSGEFNVPHGRYKNPKIVDEEKIVKANKALKNTVILCTDFTECKKYARKGTLLYFDPPYRPLNATSGFTSYTKEGFSNNDQLRLAELSRELFQMGAHVVLSNSDPKNENKKDRFFDNLYKGFNINRVEASRAINCDSKKRGLIKELIITSS